jgi:hypothetical protein
MIELVYISEKLHWNGDIFEIKDSKTDGNLNANLNLTNDQNDFWVLFLANKTTINGVIQTSSEMIVETLSS